MGHDGSSLKRSTPRWSRHMLCPWRALNQKRPSKQWVASRGWGWYLWIIPPAIQTAEGASWSASPGKDLKKKIHFWSSCSPVWASHIVALRPLTRCGHMNGPPVSSLGPLRGWPVWSGPLSDQCSLGHKPLDSKPCILKNGKWGWWTGIIQMNGEGGRYLTKYGLLKSCFSTVQFCLHDALRLEKVHELSTVYSRYNKDLQEKQKCVSNHKYIVRTKVKFPLYLCLQWQFEMCRKLFIYWWQSLMWHNSAIH